MKNKNKNVENKKQSTEVKTESKQRGGQLQVELSLEEQIKMFASLIVDHLFKDHYENNKDKG